MNAKYYYARSYSLLLSSGFEDSHVHVRYLYPHYCSGFYKTDYVLQPLRDKNRLIANINGNSDPKV